MPTDTAYIPGKTPEKSGLLARYLPPIPAGIAAAWLQESADHGSWVLDPFGASPRLPVEIARAGYRVLVTANNPVARFLIELAANPPSEDELSNALAQLAASRKGDERLEPHIKSLYATVCEQCRREIFAEAFIWEHNASTPFAKMYHCPYCGDEGERPVNQDDEINAERFAGGGLHRARALERIAPINNPDRAHAEEALSVYLPRAVYALFTLINKLESFHDQTSSISPAASSQIKRNLDALLLAAFDQANTLWSYPTVRERPKQLTVPPRFRELNIWMALEGAVGQLASSSLPIPLTIWPELPPQNGGICIFEGRLKDLQTKHLTDQKEAIAFDTVLAAFPRPNQAFWTLSALWAGWLWGRDAVGPFKSVLRRRRYDWSWHTAALHAALSHLYGLAPNHTPFFGLISETEPGFISAAILAASLARFELMGLALRAESGRTQIRWRKSSRWEPPTPKLSHSSGEELLLPEKRKYLAELISEAAREYLISRAETSIYINLHTAGLLSIINQPEFEHPALDPSEAYTQVHDSLEEAFTYRKGFLRFGGSEKSLEVGQWWLREPPGDAVVGQPLGDRVEEFVSRYLLENPGCTFLEVDTAACTVMRGLWTPDVELVRECLRSYGQQGPENGTWQLRAEDAPDVRQRDLMTMRNTLFKIGTDLDYRVSGDNPVVWRNPDDDARNEVAYVIYLTDSAMFGEFFYNNPHPPPKSIIVYPGGRSNLVVYKFRHDARLEQTLNRGWRLIKFRLLRRLAENPLINRDNLDEQLKLDPATKDAPQMRLL